MEVPGLDVSRGPGEDVLDVILPLLVESAIDDLAAGGIQDGARVSISRGHRCRCCIGGSGAEF